MHKQTRALLYGNDFFLRAKNWIEFCRRHKRYPKTPPRSFNDHLFRIKEKHLRDPLRVFISDKEFVKLYVRATVGDAYNVPTIAVLRDVEQVTAFFSRHVFDRKLVIKPTHMSGACIFADKPLSQDLLDTIRGWFCINVFHRTGQENYRDLVPKVIVEQYLDFDGEAPPKDYKLHCSKGMVTMIQVDEGRFTDHHRTFYSPDWQVLPFRVQKSKGSPIEKPANLATMIEVGEKLASNFDLIRVDLFSDGKKWWWGN